MYMSGQSAVASKQLCRVVCFKALCDPDEVAEWLRRWTANPLCSARVGSNPILVETFCFYVS